MIYHAFEDINQNKIPQKLAFSQKIEYFWLKYGDKIILTIGIMLIAGIAFEAGFLYGEKNGKDPVVVNKVAGATDISNISTTKTTNNNQLKDQPAKANIAVPETKNCPYVASKNSDKYHLASCQMAQKIKPENKVCFSSADEAQKRGFLGAKCCIK